jgi:hypothetical protein
VHVHAVDIHISQMLIGFAASEIIILAALHVFQGLIGEKGIALPAGGFGDTVL